MRPTGAEFDGGSGNLNRYYVNGPTYVDERVLVYDVATAAEYYYLLKELYTIAGLADADGQIVELYDYDAYGTVRVHQPLAPQADGDYDDDGDVDLVDFIAFQVCFVGGGTGCDAFDFDDDQQNEDIDDYLTFVLLFGGPEIGAPYATQVVSRSDLNPYFFTGRRLDQLAAAGPAMYHYRRRAYDPVHGRFLQRDPAGYVDTANLYVYARSNPWLVVDPWGFKGYTINQLIGRYGEACLVATIKKNPQKWVILYGGLGKSTAATGPDLIVYNKVDDLLEFYDNKAWQRITKVYTPPRWMEQAKFKVAEYRNVIRSGLKAANLPPSVESRCLKALADAANDPSRAVKIISSFGGRVNGIGPKVIKEGIRFVERGAVESVGARGTAGRVAGYCTVPWAMATFEVLSGGSVADAAQPLDAVGRAYLGFEINLAQSLDAIKEGHYTGSGLGMYQSPTWLAPEEAAYLHEEFVGRGYLKPRGRLSRLLKDDGDWVWSENLTEKDLDFINERIRMGALIDRLNVKLEVATQGRTGLFGY